MSGGTMERMVYMANQIADFFVAQPDDKAAAQIAEHLIAFWDPSMRRDIIAHLEATDGAGLSPAAREAVMLIKATPAKVVKHASEREAAVIPATTRRNRG